MPHRTRLLRTRYGDHVDLVADESAYPTQLLCAVIYAKAAALRRFGQFNAQLLAEDLASHGYKVAIRSALGGGTGTSCFRHLRHEFLVVMPDKRSLACCPDGSVHSLACLQGCDELILVEPNFREHFAINQSTPTYNDILRAVPVEFVGPVARLQPLVNTLAAEMHEAFASQGLERPPWRKASALLSKWVPAPSKSRDREPRSSHTSCAGSPTAVVPYDTVVAQQTAAVPKAAQDYLEALALTADQLHCPVHSVPMPNLAEGGQPLRVRSLLSSSLRRQSQDEVAFANARAGLRHSCDVTSVITMAERMRSNLCG